MSPSDSGPLGGERRLVLTVGAYLLDCRVLRPSEESFLISILEWARSSRTFYMTERQRLWFYAIADRCKVDARGDRLLNVAFAGSTWPAPHEPGGIGK